MDEDYIERPFPAFEYGEDNRFIFVSYAHKDRKIVFPEIKRFHMEGYPIWYDDGLVAGQEWDDEIAEALLASSLMVVFISKNSMASTNVQDEIKLALEEKIDVTPIYLEDTKLPPGLRLRLSNKHAIFKHKLSDKDYVRDCFKAFGKAEIPKIIEDTEVDSKKAETHINDSDSPIDYDSSVVDVASELSTAFKPSGDANQGYVINIPFEAYEGDEPYIFVSYKHNEYEKVYPIMDKLHNAGINIWYDAGIPVGGNYDIQVADHIKKSSLFVTFITEGVMAGANEPDDYMVKELSVAMHLRKVCVPIYIDDVELNGAYLIHYLGKPSIFKYELCDDEKFIDGCISLFKQFGIEPN